MNEKLTAYVLNELPPDERAELEAQMKADPALREQAEEMKVFCAMLSHEMAGEESPALTAQQRVSVMRAFTSEAPAKKIVRPFWRHPAFLVPTAIAACVAFAMVWDGNRSASKDASLVASTDSAKDQRSVPVQVSQPKAERKATAPTAPKPVPVAPERPRAEIVASPAPVLPTVAMAGVKKEKPVAGDQGGFMKAGNKTLAVSNPVPATPAAPLVAAVDKAAPTPQSRNRESLISKDAAGKPLASASKPAASKQLQLPPIVRSVGGGGITFNDPKAAKTSGATPPETRASFPYLADASTLLSLEFNDSAWKRQAAGFGDIAMDEPGREPVTLARSGLLAPQSLYDGGGTIVGFEWLSAPGILGTWERSKAHMASAPEQPYVLDAGNGGFLTGTVVLLNRGSISVADARITSAVTSMTSTKVNLGRTFALDKGLSTKGLTVGQAVTGSGVTPGTVITAINNGSTFTTNQGALKSGTADLEYGAVSPRNGTLVSSINQGNATVTVPSTVGLTRGQSVKGAGIPEGAKINSIVSGTRFTLTDTATQSDAAAPLTYSSEPIFGGKLKTTTASGTRIVVASTLELTVGQPVSGTGIPADSKITGILDDNTFEISSAVTSTGTETLSYGTSQGLAGSLLATTTAGNSVVNVPSTAGLRVGQAVTGLGIPDGTRIDAIRSDTEIVLSTASLFTGTSKLAVAGSEGEGGKSPNAPANLVFNGGTFINSGTWVLGGTNGYTGGTEISGGVLSTTGVATRADAPLTLNGGTLRYTGGTASPAGDADKQAKTTPGNVDYFGFIDYNGVVFNNNGPSGKFEGSFTTLEMGGNISGDLTLGNQSRDGDGSSVVNLSGHNQTAGTEVISFDSGLGVASASNGGNNSYFKLQGFSETSSGIADATASGVIENMEGAASDAWKMRSLSSSSEQTLDGARMGGKLELAGSPHTEGAPADPFAPDAVSGGRPADDAGVTLGGGTRIRAGTTFVTNSHALSTTTVELNGPSGAVSMDDAKAATSLVKSGAGTLDLSGANTYSDATTVSAGVLRITNGNALGSTSGNTGAQTVNGSNTTAATSPGVNLMTAPTVTTTSGRRAEITVNRGAMNGESANNSPGTLNSFAFANSAAVETPALQTITTNRTANSLSVDGGTLGGVGGQRGATVTKENRSGNAAITPDSIDGLLSGPAAEASPITSGGIITGSTGTRPLVGNVTFDGALNLNGNVTYLDTGDPISATRSGPAPAAAAAPATSMAAGKDLALATDKKKENTWNGTVNGSISGSGGVQAIRTFNTSVAPTAPTAVGLTMAGAGDVAVADGLNTFSGTITVNQGTMTVGSTSAVAPAQPKLVNGTIGGWATTDREFERKGTGTALELQGGITVGGEALTIAGSSGTPQIGAGQVPAAETTVTYSINGNPVVHIDKLGEADANHVQQKIGNSTLTLQPNALVQVGGILVTPAGPGSDVTILQNNPNATLEISATIVDAKSDEERQQILRQREQLALQQEKLSREQMEQERRLAELRRMRESSNETYTRIYENPFLFAAQQPLSTFSIDVDSASYANVRRFLNNGQSPPPDAVRLEELINYFPYAYEGPGDGKPFGVMVDVAEAPWQPLHRLVRVALKGREVKEERGTANFVFLVDVSGSMSSDDKLPLVKKSLQMLTRQLGKNDRVAMVVYAGSSGLVLPSTPGTERETILNAIGRLQSGGSTNGAGGITQAYEEAAKNFVKGGVNRVILCTDGDFNVGISSPEELEHLIAEKAKSRIFLSVLGFGTGNLKDRTMETLADKGNGNYAYIDSLSEARKVLVEQMNGTLVTIAKDVKIQVEFNPTQVAAYRLLGYENRLMAKEDFNNDKKDAGEIGAGHTVTALYEVVPATVKYPDGKPAVDELKYAPGAPKAVSPSDAGSLDLQSSLRSLEEERQRLLKVFLPQHYAVKEIENKIDALKTRIQKLTPQAASNELMTVKLRYKQPEGDKSDLLEVPVTDKEKKLADSEKDFQFAASVAGFGMLLRGSQHAGELTWDMVREMALSGKGEDKLGYRGEFLQLIDKASSVAGQRQ